jgi:hypothetical protein
VEFRPPAMRDPEKIQLLAPVFRKVEGVADFVLAFSADRRASIFRHTRWNSSIYNLT